MGPNNHPSSSLLQITVVSKTLFHPLFISVNPAPSFVNSPLLNLSHMAFESCICLLLGPWWIQKCSWMSCAVTYSPSETLISAHIITSSLQGSPSLLPFPISISLDRISQSQYYWHFRSEILSFGQSQGCPMHGSIPSLYPLDANSNLPSCNNRKSSDIAKCALGEKLPQLKIMPYN